MPSAARSGVQRSALADVGEGEAVAVDGFGLEHIAIQSCEEPPRKASCLTLEPALTRLVLPVY